MKHPIPYDEGTNPGNGWRAPDGLQFVGFHQFKDPDCDCETCKCDDQPGEWGSFEVFYESACDVPSAEGGILETAAGWYWWACFPGCLPDGEASGPFETAEAAYNDAIGE